MVKTCKWKLNSESKNCKWKSDNMIKKKIKLINVVKESISGIKSWN